MRRMAELPDSVRALFRSANFAHVASVLPGGAPHSVPVWVGLEGDRIAFFTQPGSRKARNLAADPRVAISITDHDEPYRMALRYTGKPFPVRRGIALLVEPEKVFELQLPFEHTPSR